MNREHIAVALAILVLIGLILYALRPRKEGYLTVKPLVGKAFVNPNEPQVLEITSANTAQLNGKQYRFVYNNNSNQITLNGIPYRQTDNPTAINTRSSSTSNFDVKWNFITMTNIMITNEPNGIGFRVQTVSHPSLQYIVRITPGTGQTMYTGTNLLTKQIIPMTKTPGTIYRVDILYNSILIISGTLSTPTPRPPTPSPPTPRPPTPRPPTPTANGFTAIEEKKLTKYTIIGDGIVDEDPNAWVEGDINAAVDAANQIYGCTAFVFDTRVPTKYCLKSPNFKTGDNFSTKYTSNLVPSTGIHTYFRPNGVDDANVKAAVRVQTGFKNADPSVIVYRGIYLYTYADSSGIIYIASNHNLDNGLPNSIQTTALPTENMFTYTKQLCTVGDIKKAAKINYRAKDNKDDTSYHLWAPEIVEIDDVIYIFFSFYTNPGISNVFYMYNDDKSKIISINGWVLDPTPLFGSTSNVKTLSTTIQSIGTISSLKYNWFIDPAVFKIGSSWYISVSTNVDNTIKNTPKLVEQRLILQQINIRTISGIGSRKSGTPIGSGILRTDSRITLINKPLVFNSPNDFVWEYNSSTIMYAGVVKDHQVNFGVEEGPFFLETKNYYYLLFNANFSVHPGYCIGAYRCSKTSSIMNISSWTKLPKPLFFSTPASHPGNIYGSGAPSIVEVNKRYFMFYHGSPIVKQYESRVVFAQEININNLDKVNNVSLGGSVYKLTSLTNVGAGVYLGSGFTD